MKYQGEEIGSNKCGITQICVAMAMLAGSFLTLIIIGLVINFMPAWFFNSINQSFAILTMESFLMIVYNFALRRYSTVGSATDL